MVRVVVMSVGQVIGAALLLLGLYWLVGIAWTVLVAGTGLLIVCTAGELAVPPTRRRRVPTHGEG